MQSIRFLTITTVTTLMVLIGIACINLIVDPYDLYGVVLQPGLNAKKLTHAKHDKMFKAYQISHQKPDVLLLGTSRVQYGLDPQHKALQAMAKRPYNAGLLGADMVTLWQYAQHALTEHPVHTMILGLDPLMFRQPPSSTPPFAEEYHRLAHVSPSSLSVVKSIPWSAQDLRTTLFSLTALHTSFKTVWMQHRIENELLQSGHRNPSALRLRISQLGGQRIAFQLHEQEYFKEMAKFRPEHITSDNPNMEALQALLQWARAHHIDVRLFFSPIHARMHQIHQHAQAESTFLQWQQAVAQIVEQEGIHAQQAPFPLWDFTVIPGKTDETVPELEDTIRTMRYFWDTAHYTSALGDHILATVLPAHGTLNQTLPIQPVSLKQLRLAANKVIKQHQRYFQQHPLELQEIADLLQPHQIHLQQQLDKANTHAISEQLAKGRSAVQNPKHQQPTANPSAPQTIIQ